MPTSTINGRVTGPKPSQKKCGHGRCQKVTIASKHDLSPFPSWYLHGCCINDLHFCCIWITACELITSYFKFQPWHWFCASFVNATTFGHQRCHWYQFQYFFGKTNLHRIKSTYESPSNTMFCFIVCRIALSLDPLFSTSLPILRLMFFSIAYIFITVWPTCGALNLLIPFDTYNGIVWSFILFLSMTIVR